MALPYLVSMLSALGMALVFTPVTIRLARRLKLYDRRNFRKVHSAPTPRVGGVAIVVSMTLAVGLVLLFPSWFGSPFSETRQKLLVLFATSGGIFLLGLVDDVRGLPAKVKLLGQFVAALVVCAAGIRIDMIPQFDWMFGQMGWIVTIGWILAITNAMNLIDGLDGLSAGISSATCATVAAFAIFNGRMDMAILMLALLGSLVGFLVFNFNPAKIFMGDGGSMFLGFFIATASVLSATKVAAVMGLILPALALGLPLFDMLLSIFRRILDRRSVFSADRDHVHHRLMDMGLKHHHAVIVMYAVTILTAGIGLAMMFFRGQGEDSTGEIVVFVAVLLVLMFLFRIAGVLRFRRIWNQVQENYARSREIRRDRREFETIRNRFRQAWTFEQWWRAVRRMARRMGFRRTVVVYRDADGRECQKAYDLPQSESSIRPEMSIDIPGRSGGRLLRVEIHVPVDETLETIGRRISLFGRLLDEHQPLWTEVAEKPQPTQPVGRQN